MNNISIITRLSIILIFFGSCEKTENIEIITLRVNHYQQPVNYQEFFYGLSYMVQEGEEIVNDRWNMFSNIISGFDYELGYIYDIEVQKKNIKDPMVDMPNAQYTLNRILSKTKVPQETTFDITLTINYSNEFESLVTKNELNKYSLLGKTEIDCGEMCSILEEKIENQLEVIGIFKHLDNKTIQLIMLGEPNK